MKKNIIKLGLVISALAPMVKAQLLTNSNIQNQISKSNVFLDASTNYSTEAGAPPYLGKGVVIPGVDLVNFEFDLTMADGFTFPSYFDGMIVYNKATGNTLTTGNRPSTSTYVTPGYYYFSNPNGSINGNITGGVWKSIGGDNPWKNADGTTATGLSKDINFTKSAGSVTIGNSSNVTNFNVTGGVKFDGLGSNNKGSNLLMQDELGNVQKISVDDLRTLINGANGYQTLGSGRIFINDIGGGSTQWNHLYGSDIINTTANVTLSSAEARTANLQIDFKNPISTADYIVLASVNTPKDNQYYLTNFHLNTLISQQTTNSFIMSVREEVEGARSHYIDYVIMYNKNRNLASVSGPGTGADNTWHTALLSEKGKYAVNSMSIRASTYLDGELTLNGEIQSEALNSADKIYQGEFGITTLGSQTNTRDQSSDFTYHTTVCPDNRLMTGVQIWASENYLDGYMKVECTALNTGYKTNVGIPSIGGQGPGTGADNQLHFAKCPEGQYAKGVRIYANNWFDGNMGLYCTPIIKQ